MKITVIKDTREQQGWEFEPNTFCNGMEIGTLKTGDYSIKGHEKLICIERKKSVLEIATNLGKKYTTFQKEIKRMAEFEHAYIICEFSFNELIHYPNLTKLPPSLKRTIKLRGPYLLKKIVEIQLDTNVKIMFCGNAGNAFAAASSILKNLGERIND